MLAYCLNLKAFQAEKYQDVLPVPQSFQVGEGHFLIDEDLRIGISGAPDERIFEASTRFLRRLSERTGVFLKDGYIKTHLGVTGNLMINIWCT